MAAERQGGHDELVYYHGTVHGLEGEDDWAHIEPNRGANFSASEAGFAYATSNRQAAEWYAERVYWERGWSWTQPIVYEVRPTGPVEADPAFEGTYSRANFAGDVRSRHPFEIVDKHELPGEWHCEQCGSIDHRNADHELEQGVGDRGQEYDGGFEF